mgnify:CR=1
SKTEATKSKVMSGTPLINSMKPTQIIFTKGRFFDCRPKASKIPIGKEATIPVTPTINERVKPPNFRDSTKGRLRGSSSPNKSAMLSEIKRKNITVKNSASNKETEFDLISLRFNKKYDSTPNPIP